MDLAQPLVGDDLQPGAVGERRVVLITPRQILGIQTARPIGSKNLRCADAWADPTTSSMGMSGSPGSGRRPCSTPGATVAPKDDPRRCHRRSSTRSSISGQSPP